MNLSVYVFFMSVATIVAGFLSIYSFSRKYVPGNKEMALMMLLVAIWALTSIFEASYQTVREKTFWSVISYIGSQPFTGAFMLFSLRYTNKDKKINRYNHWLVFVFPAIMFILAATNSFHSMVWSNIYLIEVPGGLSAVYERGAIFLVNAFYNYALVIVGILLLVKHFFLSPDKIFNSQTKLLFIASLFPFIANILYVFIPSLIGGFDPTPLSFTVTNFFLIWAVFQFRLLDLVPVAWERVVDTLEDGILIIDNQMRIVDWNPILENWLRLKPSFAGMQYETILKNWPTVIEACKEESDRNIEIDLILLDSRKRTMEVRIVPFSDRKGRALGKIVTFHDVTEEKKAQRELENAKATAESASRAKSDFLASMSHEIRNPLQGIGGMVYLLSKTGLSDVQVEYTHRIQSALDTLSGIINDILDFSKIEAGKMALELIDFNLHTLIKDVMYLFQPLAQGKRLTISLDIADSLPEECHGDSLRIRQILINLISNALKFTPEGGQIKIMAEGDKQNTHSDNLLLIFRVTDNGIGISEDQLGKLFTAFHQADGTIARRFGGTGLGLAICKALVEKMGGQITVASQLGKGTTFTFTLHLSKPKKTVKPEPKDEKPVSLVSGKRVLYIEDNRVNRLIMVEILATFGLIVTPVDDGESALTEIKEKTFDMVITDIFLPDMKGYELAEKIRLLIGESCPIIALTASGTKEIREKSFQSGISLFLMKPILPGRLLAELNRFFEEAGGSVKDNYPVVVTADENKAFPKSLAGIDCEIAQEMVGGDSEMYKNVLKLFHESLQETEETIENHLSKRQFREAAGVLHRTKESSNAIGAIDFARACEALETIVSPETPGQYTEAFEQWKTQLRRILNSEEIKLFLRE